MREVDGEHVDHADRGRERRDAGGERERRAAVARLLDDDADSGEAVDLADDDPLVGVADRGERPVDEPGAVEPQRGLVDAAEPRRPAAGDDHGAPPHPRPALGRGR